MGATPAPPSVPITTEIVETWSDLDRLGSAWDDLVVRSRADSLFLRWDWIDAWRRAIGESVRPFVVVAREADGEVVGFAPLYAAPMRLVRFLPLRALRVLGDDQSGSEYPDWIVPKDREDEVTAALARALFAARGRWDCLWMPRMAGWTGAHDRTALACRREGMTCHVRDTDFSAFQLPARYEEYFQKLSGNARSTLRRRAKELEKQGATIEACRTPEELEPLLEALVRLNHLRWSAVGQTGTFVRKPLELQFYRLFTRRALERGWLRFFALRLAGEIRAVQIGYAYEKVFCQLQEGFDPEAPDGVGNVLRSRVIERCIEEGLTGYDFLGEHTEHKRRWLSESRSGHDVLVVAPNGISRLLLRIPIWPTGRYLRPIGLQGAAPDVAGRRASLDA